jgi:hypothetical protein
MRSLSTFVTAGLMTLFLAAPAAAATATPGSSYQWQQPGCAPVSTPCAQPQSINAPVSQTGLQYASSAAYAWTQPGTAPVSVPDGQPW